MSKEYNNRRAFACIKGLVDSLRHRINLLSDADNSDSIDNIIDTSIKDARRLEKAISIVNLFIKDLGSTINRLEKQ